MLKKILTLQGIQQLSVNEQKSISGGSVPGPIQCDQWNPLGAMTYAECLSYRPLQIQYISGNCKVYGPSCES